jgi:uncharacterized protein (TIGR02301 family)
MMVGRVVLFLSLSIAPLCLPPVAGAAGRSPDRAMATIRVAAAEGETKDAAPAGEPAPGEPASGAPYMQPLARLSSILGSVHFLRRLCGDGEAGVWRDKMNEMLATLSPNAADRQILVAAFNDGFRAFESTYRNCTPAARVALARYQAEGATLSREISARYGN